MGENESEDAKSERPERRGRAVKKGEAVGFGGQGREGGEKRQGRSEGGNRGGRESGQGRGRG